VAVESAAVVDAAVVSEVVAEPELHAVRAAIETTTATE
jgi:hypothetical protein